MGRNPSLVVISASLLLMACHPSHRELLDKADVDALDQRSLVAKHIYLQVSKEHTGHDEIRYRALKGLVNIALTQTYEYPMAAAAIEKIVDEYENDAQFRSEIPEWRKKLASVYRLNLQKPRRALEVLHPILNRGDLPEVIDQEIGRTLLSMNEYAEAEVSFQRAWSKAVQNKDCALLSQLQLELIQTFSLSKRCDRAIEWTDKKLPEGCETDRFALAVEKANCLEIGGDADGAMKIYESLVKSNPKNLRAQYLLENIKRRERKKEIK
jgi:tetratricopeptide (TPR) repeat protein